MNQHVALDVTLATSTPERRGAPRLWLVCFFIIAVGIVTIAALTGGSLSSDQRVEVFQDAGIYP